ncbi:Gfo/Idh/MocA family oxidoreductase [Mesorhizobium sp. M00.F.Ca.ET.151.01.1.1]|nr:Gfo/Idh/MocA family oxidoreductase [Mesorhizobium sp. M00.F.Ca.ET.151.01.1.1]
MTNNDTFGRRLRLGMVGGGGSSSIGPSHAAAARLDGRWDLVAGVFSRSPERTKQVALELFVDVDRAYADYSEMAVREAGRPDGIDAVTICTFNETHYEIADTFLSKGIHVICDKPLVVTREHARALSAKVAETGQVLAVTYTYSGYPMVRMARDMIAGGKLGDILSVQVEYASHYQTQAFGKKDWQHDQAKTGVLGVVASLGTHAFQLAEYASGLRVEALAADLACLRNPLDDHANMLLRFHGGARGALWTTSIAHGCPNGLTLRIYGTDAALTWHQEHPEQLAFSASGQQPVLLARGGVGVSAGARAATRTPAGHPEGYLEAFANIYSAVARAISEGRNTPVNEDFPTVNEGARGVGFMFTALKSAQLGSIFVAYEL